MAPPHVVARHLERLRAGGAPVASDELEDPLKDAIIIDGEHTMIDEEKAPPVED
jgi:hypothetical protein